MCPDGVLSVPGRPASSFSWRNVRIVVNPQLRETPPCSRCRGVPLTSGQQNTRLHRERPGCGIVLCCLLLITARNTTSNIVDYTHPEACKAFESGFFELMKSARPARIIIMDVGANYGSWSK